MCDVYFLKFWVRAYNVYFSQEIKPCNIWKMADTEQRSPPPQLGPVVSYCTMTWHTYCICFLFQNVLIFIITLTHDHINVLQQFLLSNKLETAMWLSRLFTVYCSIMFILPLLGWVVFFYKALSQAFFYHPVFFSKTGCNFCVEDQIDPHWFPFAKNRHYDKTYIVACQTRKKCLCATQLD